MIYIYIYRYSILTIEYNLYAYMYKFFLGPGSNYFGPYQKSGRSHEHVSPGAYSFSAKLKDWMNTSSPKENTGKD